MKAFAHVLAITFLASSTFLTSSRSMSAQTAVAENVHERLAAAVQKLQAACATDLNRFCSTVTPGEGRQFFCVMAHEDKISTKCDHALYDAFRNVGRAVMLIGQAADLCWPDIEKYCADIPEGGGRIAQCLVDKKASLDRGCQAALDQLPATKQ
jgi:Golgi apparatus protein 1